MRVAASALPLVLALASAAWADDGDDDLPRALSLSEERRRAKAQEETDPQRPQELPADEGPGAMEYLYRNFEFELGMLWTNFDSDLQIETDLGWYLRAGVRFAHGFSAHVTYRHYEFTSSDLPGNVSEDISLRALLAGGSYHLPLTKEFALVAAAAAGFERWESNLHQFSDDAGFVGNAELALTARLWTVLRLKIGAVYDLARTDFHQEDHEWNGNLSGILAFELGL